MPADRARRPSGAGQNAEPYKATLAVRSDRPGAVIDRNIYGRLNAMNTFDRPTVVKPAPFDGHKLQGSQLTLSVPAKSAVLPELR